MWQAPSWPGGCVVLILGWRAARGGRARNLRGTVDDSPTSSATVGYGSGSGSANQIAFGPLSRIADFTARLPSRTRQERALEAVDLEDLKRRCATHDQWMAVNPHAIAFSETWAAGNYDELARNAADALR